MARSETKETRIAAGQVGAVIEAIRAGPVPATSPPTPWWRKAAEVAEIVTKVFSALLLVASMGAFLASVCGFGPFPHWLDLEARKAALSEELRGRLSVTTAAQVVPIGLRAEQSLAVDLIVRVESLSTAQLDPVALCVCFVSYDLPQRDAGKSKSLNFQVVDVGRSEAIFVRHFAPRLLSNDSALRHRLETETAFLKDCPEDASVPVLPDELLLDGKDEFTRQDSFVSWRVVPFQLHFRASVFGVDRRTGEIRRYSGGGMGVVAGTGPQSFPPAPY